MSFPYYLLLPLSSAIGYALAALMLKRAMAFGVGPWRITFFSNWAMALLALPLLALPVEPAGDFVWHLPVWTALAFLLGQLFTFLALFRGDVSVATPLMGTKVLFVALLTVFLLGEPVPLSWWIGAFLATAALGLLGGGKSSLHGRLWPTIPFALLGALMFASMDLMLQQWASGWGVTRFLPAMGGMVAIYSVVFVPFFRKPLFSVRPGGWRWLGSGAAMLGVQALIMSYALGSFGNATAMNIAYSTRGVWSVLLIWIAGQWFMNEERSLGSGVMVRRLIGSGMLLAAVILVILS